MCYTEVLHPSPGKPSARHKTYRQAEAGEAEAPWRLTLALPVLLLPPAGGQVRLQTLLQLRSPCLRTKKPSTC